MQKQAVDSYSSVNIGRALLAIALVGTAATAAGLYYLSTTYGMIFTVWILIFAKWVSNEDGFTPADTTRKGLLQNKYHEAKVPEQLDAIVIGSGMGGLSAAATLSRMGKRVVVFEQHDIAGGGTHTYEFKKGWLFDSGLHYAVPYCSDLLKLCCDGIATPPPFTKMGEADGTFDKVALGDQPIFDYKHKEAHLPELYARFPENKADIDRFMNISNQVLFGFPFFVLSKFLPPVDWMLNLWDKLFLTSFNKWCSQTTSEVLDQITNNKLLSALLCGLWVDTGSPPDRCTFMLSAAVFRGLSIEGGAYPEGGSHAMAGCLVPVIEMNGGAVLVKCYVKSIDVENGRAVGVTLYDDNKVTAPIVISAVGYHNTFNKLVNETVTSKFSIPRRLSIPDSDGFLMVNVSLNGSAQELDLKCQNIWYHPVTKETGYSMDAAIEAYLTAPDKNDACMMFTFPSLKDRAHERSPHRNKSTCQILVLTPYKWFEEHKDEPCGKRSAEYNEMKHQWEERCMKKLYDFYPQLKGKVDSIDTSTPLTIEHYLQACGGGAIGLDHHPARYTDREVIKQLNMRTKVPDLWITGQDTFICGVPLAQIAGIITAMRILGWGTSLNFIAGHVRRGLRRTLGMA